MGLLASHAGITFDNMDVNPDAKGLPFATSVTDSVDLDSTPSKTRTTAYTYDLRGRLVRIAPEIAPYTLYTYDNLNRSTATARYSALPSVTAPIDPGYSGGNAHRLAAAQTLYDCLGRPYRALQFLVAANGSIPTNVSFITSKPATDYHFGPAK